jgi:hypothetical protein
MDINFISMILGDEGEENDVLSSLSSASISGLVFALGKLFQENFAGDYDKVEGTVLGKYMRKVKHFVISQRPGLLEQFVKTSSCSPCFLCCKNLPCEICRKSIPFDIFVSSSKNNKFAYSCRPKLHQCLKCSFRKTKKLN